MVLDLKNYSKIKLMGNPQCNFKRVISAIEGSMVFAHEDMPKENRFEEEAKKRAIENAMRRAGGLRAPMPYTMDMPSLHSSSRYKSRKLTREEISSCTKNGTLIIVAGDSGLGAHSKEYYDKTFVKLNNILAYNNTVLVFVRGNHDNPSVFDGDTINYSNIKATPDYTIIETKEMNILCVGGGISVDRTWLKEQEKRVNRFAGDKKKQMYWDGENTICDEAAITEYLSTGKKINMVVSHMGPSFIAMSNDASIEKWKDDDKALTADIGKQHYAIDMIYMLLNKLDSVPTYWAYSHNCIGELKKVGNIIFRELTHPSLYSPIMDIRELSPKKSEKRHKTSLKTKISTRDLGVDFNDVPFERFLDGNDGRNEERTEPAYEERTEPAYEERIEPAYLDNALFANAQVANIDGNEPVAINVDTIANGTFTQRFEISDDMRNALDATIRGTLRR